MVKGVCMCVCAVMVVVGKELCDISPKLFLFLFSPSCISQSSAERHLQMRFPHLALFIFSGNIVLLRVQLRAYKKKLTLSSWESRDVSDYGSESMERTNIVLPS